MIGLNFSPSADSFSKDLILKDNLRGERFRPITTNITGVTASYGIYQRAFGVTFVFIKFVSNGSLAFPTNATIRLPITPFARNGVYEFSTHSFELSQQGASGSQKCWMNSATGLVSPIAAVTASASNWVFSGYYLTE